MDAREYLLANLALVDRVVAFVSRRGRLSDSDAEEFAAIVKLKLVENDYAIVRKFEGRSSFSTFLAVVIQRMLLDHRVRLWGKWHPSAEATRMGEMTVEVERMLHRDGRSLPEILASLRDHDASFSEEQLADLISRLPKRLPKRVEVDLDEARSVPAAVASGGEHVRTSGLVSTVIRRFIESMEKDDRLILQLRFDSGMSVAQIARSLGLDQKQLYRRVERLLAQMRESLLRAGVERDTIRELLSASGAALDFDLRSTAAGTSIHFERATAVETKEYPS